MSSTNRRKGGSGLGDYFISSVRADIEGLRIFGGVHRVLTVIIAYSAGYSFRRVLSKGR